MTPFGKSVATELQSALVPIETASIVDYRYLRDAMRALLHNALFYVVPTAATEAGRARVMAQTIALADAIAEVGVQTQGISLELDQARTEATLAMQDLIDVVADAEPTPAGRALGLGFS